MLMRYLEHDFPKASESERAAFAALLERPDPELQALLWGAEPGDDPLVAGIVAKIHASGTADDAS